MSGDGLTSDSKDVQQTSSALELDITDVCRELDYAGTRFRRIRDDILDNFKANFRRLEDIFNDWNKECLDLSNSIIRKNVAQAKRSKPSLQRKMKEALGGLREIEDLGKTVNSKLGKVVSELTIKSASSY